MKTLGRFVLCMLLALLVACQPSTQQTASAQKGTTGTPTSGVAADVLLACLASDRDKWLANALPESMLFQMWGDLGWIDQVKDPALRKRYQAVFDLSAGQHTVSAQKLMAAINAQAGKQAPDAAKEIERYMSQQYEPNVPEDSDAFDAEFRAALATSAAQLRQARQLTTPISKPWRPFADLAVEGVVYHDDFAQACAMTEINRAPRADRVAASAAIAKTQLLVGAAVLPASGD